MTGILPAKIINSQQLSDDEFMSHDATYREHLCRSVTLGMAYSCSNGSCKANGRNQAGPARSEFPKQTRQPVSLLSKLRTIQSFDDVKDS